MTTSKQEMIDKANELLAAAALLPDDKPKPKPWPQTGDKYYACLGRGLIDSLIWHGTFYDAALKAQGNIFKTRAEAAHKSNVNAATTKVVARIKELNEGWVPDFSDSIEGKYLPTLYAGEMTYEVVYRYQARPANHYLKNNALYAQLIDELPKDLRLMIEG